MKAPRRKQSLRKDGVLYLVRGRDGDEPAWHYIWVEKRKLPLFTQALKQGEIDIVQFGGVLRSGWGDNPPPDVIQAMEEEYS